MKKLTTTVDWFGPFDDIVVTDVAYVCDGCVLPFDVVGLGVISEYDSATDTRPLTPEQGQVLYTSIVAQTQQRLDDFAKTRSYDGILSACSYSGSPTVKFDTEGQYCVTQRDATWTTLISMFDEVQAGTRPAPTSYADVEPYLPPLVWPA